MKQRAHAWVALRALKLIDDYGKAPKLAELLSFYVADAWDGAWLPDIRIVDMSYGHTYKMDSDTQFLGVPLANQARLKVPYKELNKQLTGKRLCLNYAKDSAELNKPYRSHPKKGGHLPNRVIAISHTVGDMLKMSDFPMAFYAKNKKVKVYLEDLSAQKVKDLSLSPNFSARQIALMMFILSHYVCDAHMPLHCDYRDFTISGTARRIPKKLHPSIEEKWESFFPDKDVIMLHNYTKASVDDVVKNLPQGSMIEIDTVKKYQVSDKIANIKDDEWVEMVHICRASYAMARKWIGQPYKNAEDLIDKKGEQEFKDVTNRIFHDAVESVARIWLKAWKRFTE